MTSGFSARTDAMSTLGSQWEAFQAGGEILRGVRPEIAASWQRTAGHQLQVELPAVPVDEAALRGFDHAGHARSQFLRAAREVAAELAVDLRDSHSAVIVCDDFGVILHRSGSADVLRSSEQVNLAPGGVWNEQAAGTNAIGLALELGDLAHVYASEHYLGAFHSFSCTAAPVRHPLTREVLGVVGLAADTTVTGAVVSALIARAALGVERRLEQQVFGRERELLEHHLRGQAGQQPPYLTVDRGGHTIIQNARMLQSASSEDVKLLLSFAGQALRCAADRSELLELSRGRSRAEAHLIYGGPEVLGAIVSIQHIDRDRGSGGCTTAVDWAPLIGRSPAMRRMFRDAEKVAHARVRTAIWGEPGTGKLTLAAQLHRIAGEHGPLSVVHCARDTWPAEWGRARADAGTIVLNRLHALGLRAQLELADDLDALDESERPWVIGLINSEAARPVDELLLRIAGVSLTVPPLRDRGHDVRLLIDAWCREQQRDDAPRPVLRPEAHEVLAARRWPGNVRELRNALAAALLRGGSVIGIDSLAAGEGARPALGPATGSLREIERAAIDGALSRNGGNVTRAARELGVGRATLHRRLRAYRLIGPPEAPGS